MGITVTGGLLSQKWFVIGLRRENKVLTSYPTYDILSLQM
jgi:hypothetical protein